MKDYIWMAGCARCGKPTHVDDLELVDGQLWCPTCFETYEAYTTNAPGCHHA
jgi:formylmethanofuran dehydrogenase subunit E